MFKYEFVQGRFKFTGNIYRNEKEINKLVKLRVSFKYNIVDSFEQYFIGRISARNKPLLLWFHGWSKERDHFYDLHPDLHSEFNILFPQDRLGRGTCGSWWLGGAGPSNWLYPLLTKALVEKLLENGYVKDILLCGSSMGGYGALFNSLFYSNSKCFVSVPQTTLEPFNNYWNTELGLQTLAKIGIDKDNYFQLLHEYPFLDLNKFSGNDLSITLGRNPLTIYGLPSFVHITTTCMENNSIDSQPLDLYTLPFCANLQRNQRPFSLKVIPIKGHDLFFTPTAVAYYYINNINIICLDKDKSFSYNELVDKGMFLDSYPYL